MQGRYLGGLRNRTEHFSSPSGGEVEFYPMSNVDVQGRLNKRFIVLVMMCSHGLEVRGDTDE